MWFALLDILRRPDQQDLSVPVQLGGGLSNDLGEGLPGPAVDLQHPANRITRRKDAAKTRGHEQIPGFDVRTVGQIRQTEAAAVARPDHDRAQSVPID